MPDKTIKITGVKLKLALIFAGMLFAASAVFAAKWCFAQTIATRAEAKELAEFTIKMAPADPQTHYAFARTSEKTFLPEDFERALTAYETAVSLAPHDYRLWLELGKARERNGDAEGAEKALRRAAELAPNYSQVAWTLGNALLRQEKTVEAFEWLRRAAAADDKFVAPIVVAARQQAGSELSEIQRLLGDSPDLKAELAASLAAEKRFDEALEIWRSLPDAEKAEKSEKLNAVRERIFNQLIAEKRFRDAFSLQADNLAGGESLEVGKIINPGFEANVKPEGAGLFEWQIAAGAHPQIGVDTSQKRGGSQSLVLLFNSADGKLFREIRQTVAVEAGRNYEFIAFYKSDLKTTGTVRWEVIDGASGAVLAQTEAAAEKADWSPLAAQFKTDEDAQAVIIRLARTDCKSAFCPIAGKIWFDDFALQQK